MEFQDVYLIFTPFTYTLLYLSFYVFSLSWYFFVIKQWTWNIDDTLQIYKIDDIYHTKLGCRWIFVAVARQLDFIANNKKGTWKGQNNVLWI